MIWQGCGNGRGLFFTEDPTNQSIFLGKVKNITKILKS